MIVKLKGTISIKMKQTLDVQICVLKRLTTGHRAEES